MLQLPHRLSVDQMITLASRAAASPATAAKMAFELSRVASSHYEFQRSLLDDGNTVPIKVFAELDKQAATVKLTRAFKVKGPNHYDELLSHAASVGERARLLQQQMRVTLEQHRKTMELSRKCHLSRGAALTELEFVGFERLSAEVEPIVESHDA